MLKQKIGEIHEFGTKIPSASWAAAKDTSTLRCGGAAGSLQSQSLNEGRRLPHPRTHSRLAAHRVGYLGSRGALPDYWYALALGGGLRHRQTSSLARVDGRAVLMPHLAHVCQCGATLHWPRTAKVGDEKQCGCGIRHRLVPPGGGIPGRVIPSLTDNRREEERPNRHTKHRRNRSRSARSAERAPAEQESRWLSTALSWIGGIAIALVIAVLAAHHLRY